MWTFEALQLGFLEAIFQPCYIVLARFHYTSFPVASTRSKLATSPSMGKLPRKRVTRV